MYRVTFSILETTANALLILFMLNAIRNEKRITGRPVPSANKGGSSNASFDLRMSGIRTPKKSTPL